MNILVLASAERNARISPRRKIRDKDADVTVRLYDLNDLRPKVV